MSRSDKAPRILSPEYMIQVFERGIDRKNREIMRSDLQRRSELEREMKSLRQAIWDQEAVIAARGK